MIFKLCIAWGDRGRRGNMSRVTSNLCVELDCKCIGNWPFNYTVSDLINALGVYLILVL